VIELDVVEKEMSGTVGAFGNSRVAGVILDGTEEPPEFTARIEKVYVVSGVRLA